MTPEQLINELNDKIANLEKELEQSKQDIEDFEKLAIEWKNGYEKEVQKLKIEIMHLEQIIKDIQL